LWLRAKIFINNVEVFVDEDDGADGSITAGMTDPATLSSLYSE
jgi:hypothetical protein